MSRTVELARDERAPAEARAALDALGPLVDPDLVPQAKLLVSELVTNSVRHGSGRTVNLVLDAPRPDRLRCEVVDGGSGFLPVARSKPATEVGGWGLHLVEALADSWGVHEGSTHVWFELTTGA